MWPVLSIDGVCNNRPSREKLSTVMEHVQSKGPVAEVVVVIKVIPNANWDGGKTGGGAGGDKPNRLTMSFQLHC